MSPTEVGQLVGLLGFIFVAVLVIASVLLPFAVFSIAGSLRGIRRELERLNGAAAPARGGLFPHATERAPEPDTPALSHRLTR